jgi:hypothetical protein
LGFESEKKKEIKRIFISFTELEFSFFQNMSLARNNYVRSNTRKTARMSTGGVFCCFVEEELEGDEV